MNGQDHQEFKGFTVAIDPATTVPSFSEYTSGFHSTPVPNQLIDELLSVLSGNQLKVVMYIIRRTLGFNKRSDSISLNQMLNGITKKDGTALDHGVGMTKPTLLKALRELIDKGIITRKRRVATGNGSAASRYSLKFVEVQKRPSTQPAATEQLSNTNTDTSAGGSKEILPGGGKKSLPPTKNKSTKKLNNVVGKTQKSHKPEPLAKSRDEIDYLISQMTTATGDTHSNGGFAKAAMLLPNHKIFTAISEIKQAPNVRNKGAYLMGITKNMNTGSSPPN